MRALRPPRAAIALAALLLLAPALTAVAAAPAPSIQLPTATHELDGKIRDAVGLVTAPAEGTAEQIAWSYLRSHAYDLGIPSLDQVHATSRGEGLTQTTLRFEQSWQGVPVVGSEVGITVRKDGAIQAVHSRAVERVRPLASPITSAQAIVAASAVAEGTPVSAAQVYLAQGLEGVPAWEVKFFQAKPLSSWLVHVDESTGEVLEGYDTVYSAEAPAQVWLNPIVQSRNPDLRDGVFGVGQSPAPVIRAPDLTKYYWQVKLDNLDGSGKLAGPNVMVTDGFASGTDFRFAREDPRFEETNAYYWIDWSQKNIQAMGYDKVVHYQLQLVMHDQDTVFNAFYQPNGQGQGPIHYGWHAPAAEIVGTAGLPLPVPGLILSGFADAAEDAEVILHEYGHAILDNERPNFFGREGGGMHEGFGDWWSAIQLSRKSNGTFDSCTAEWFTSYIQLTNGGLPPCLRNLDNQLSYDYQGTEPHATGMIWSGALWNIWQSIGREDAEKLVLEANFLLPQDGGFADGAAALLLADANLNKASHARLILDEFKSRNVTQILVTQDLLTKLKAADSALSAQGGAVAPKATPGAEGALFVGAIAVAAAVGARRRRSPP